MGRVRAFKGCRGHDPILSGWEAGQSGALPWDFAGLHLGPAQSCASSDGAGCLTGVPGQNLSPGPVGDAALRRGASLRQVPRHAQAPVREEATTPVSTLLGDPPTWACHECPCTLEREVLSQGSSCFRSAASWCLLDFGLSCPSVIHPDPGLKLSPLSCCDFSGFYGLLRFRFSERNEVTGVTVEFNALPWASQVSTCRRWMLLTEAEIAQMRSFWNGCC